MVQLLQRFSQAMRNLHVSATKLPHQLRIVVSRHRKRLSRFRHAHHQFQDFRNLWSTIDQIAEEDYLSTLRMASLKRLRELVTKAGKQCLELVETSMYVTDNIEWSMLLLAVVPERLPFDSDCCNLFRCREFVDVTKAFAFEIAQRASQLLTLLPDYVWSKTTIGSLAISILAKAVGQVEHDSYWNNVILACQCDQWFPRLGLHIGSIHYSQLAGCETLGGNEMQYFKSVFGCCLIVFVVRHEGTAKVGREHFSRFEVIPRKRRLSAP
jgi:hypothetical protein